MRRPTIIIMLFSALAVLSLAGLPTVAAKPVTPTLLHLRRTTFDPLRAFPPATEGMRAAGTSQLILVQFDQVPDAGTRAALEASGLHPLLYVPDNAFLVRARDTHAASTIAALPGLRWSGPFQIAYKLPADLDPWLSDAGAGTPELRLVAAPDADVGALAGDLRAAGAVVSESSTGLNGTSLRVKLPPRALREVLERDDVLWAERFNQPQLHNDRARQILGVTAAREQLGLTGAGQIVAVTDTGLDNQANLSADFAGRIAAGFSNRDMSDSCSRMDWSDHNGHGTHVAGTILGSGAQSPDGSQFAGIAPQARLVVQSVSSGGPTLDCFADAPSFLARAHEAGARVQNASWGSRTGTDMDGSPQYGGYTDREQYVDSYLWRHKDHLLVVSAGNSGEDNDGGGVIDSDSISSPGTAKNVLTVGATENNRPRGEGGCSASRPENYCWMVYYYYGWPFANDFVSDDVDGMAAFSGRGPTDDGRIKPEISAPGVNIISARSHAQNPPAYYYAQELHGPNYAYKSGTSMAAPMISGMAALVRQWLVEQRAIARPSAALVKALLLNGAADIAPGQYGDGPQREIPTAWPNSVAGWGRATMTDTVGLGGDDRIWLRDAAEIQNGATLSYPLDVSGDQPLRITLAWTDYPGSPVLDKQLVNDLDLDVQLPDGTALRGNANGDLRSDCRDAAGADRCNNVESIEVSEPAAGSYIIRVRGAAIPYGPQPFALVARAGTVAGPRPTGAPALQAAGDEGTARVALAWDAVGGATYYQVQKSTSASFAAIRQTIATTRRELTLVEEVGTYYFRVRGCDENGCGPYSAHRAVTVTTPPARLFVPLLGR